MHVYCCYIRQLTCQFIASIEPLTMQAFLLYMDPEGENLCTDSQHWTSQFTVTQSAPTVSGLKAKIAELQKQLTILEV